ncbi:MAG: nucleotide sugar dehydrogenase [Leeuwenhoekiella sp.]
MKPKIGIIGLGYVGLPLAQLFAKKHAVVGFDLNTKRISALKTGHDHTGELSAEALQLVLKRNDCNENGLFCTTDSAALAACTVFIVTVPTPIDAQKNPDLSALVAASSTVGKVLKNGDVVIYESTVYPGVTEETCVPILSKISGLEYNIDFSAGYSPERINPGDKVHTVDKIVKVTSGSNPETAKFVDDLYASVITAGTYLAPSIKVAEAAKVIENSQRDINIAFVNELAKIFNKMDLDTAEVLAAAGTKWNFLNFRPGLVGGHCIGVDPYYLAQKAKQLGYHPEIILAGRRVNDSMGLYVAAQVVKLMAKREIPISKSKILILGITFKEDCPDVRNTRVVDIIRDLQDYGSEVSVYDPLAKKEQVLDEYGISLLDTPEGNEFDAIVLAVGHSAFINLNLSPLKTAKAVVFDVKGFLAEADGRL